MKTTHIAANLDTGSPIEQGIKYVGVGKRGSKSLPVQLAQDICRDWQAHRIPEIAKGAFLGALIIKGVTEEERILENVLGGKGALENPERLVGFLTSEAPPNIQRFAIRLLQQDTLTQDEARDLADYLLLDQPGGDALRGLAASVLRVRYETPEEYAGLLESLQAHVVVSFRDPVPMGNPIVQLSEPFDGVDHSYLLTPLLAQTIQQRGYRVVNLVGRNSGPKFGNNLLDIAQGLKLPFVRGSRDLQDLNPLMGWYIHQKDLSPALDRWVELRRTIIKRPFFSTLEKFLNPVDARIIVTSAFHPPYGEKMTTIAERAGFPAAIVVRNGLEGTLSFPLKRPVKILCSVRQKVGDYIRQELTFDPEQYLGVTVPVEEKLTDPSLAENIRLIEDHLAHQKTDNDLFDLRVQATAAGILQGLEWIEKNFPAPNRY
jgi:anthranilate phosphoribosyltransferase